MQALGGAKNHMIVLPDADIDMAADAAVSAAYGSAGERCMAISQVVAVGDAGDKLVEAIKLRLPKIKVGNGLDEGVEMGPLVTREHRDKVASYIEGGAEQGATVVVDGRETAPEGDGFFLGVTLLDDVTPDMDAYKDEIFGPVLGVTRVGTYDEAVKLVNENPYGNGTAIFTRDGGAARQFQFEVEAGMVGINVPIPVPVAYYSFGGWKASLFGDTHIYGPEGINFYTRGKVVTSRWPDPATLEGRPGLPADAVGTRRARGGVLGAMRILVAVLVLAAAAATAAAGGTSVPVRTCAERIEAGDAPLRFPAASPNRVFAGRLAFSGHFPRTPAELGRAARERTVRDEGRGARPGRGAGRACGAAESARRASSW